MKNMYGSRTSVTFLKGIRLPVLTDTSSDLSILNCRPEVILTLGNSHIFYQLGIITFADSYSVKKI
jgi:hypothetical protein